MALTVNHYKDYLKETDVIDYKNPDIMNLAKALQRDSENTVDLVKKCFEYVRDEIKHSADIDGKVVTCKASEVYRHKEGICYAKSHLLAALLRANNIPSGFAYQRLILDDTTAPYLILHGLNTVYLEPYNKWIRLDARGNKVGVNAQFSLAEEKLAFIVREDLGEEDIHTNFAEPDRNILNSLRSYRTVKELFDNLPKDLAAR